MIEPTDQNSMFAKALLELNPRELIAVLQFLENFSRNQATALRENAEMLEAKADELRITRSKLASSVDLKELFGLSDDKKTDRDNA